MRRLLLGVIGHVDHGKTALVRALTGTDTDRLPEERRRGISIALGFAHLRLGNDEIDIIDMPGHERFVRTMVSGATGIDAVLLAVAANEGVKPQTVEHVDIAALLGITRALLVLTKTDLVSAEEAAAAAETLAGFAAKAGLRPVAPPILTSALAGTGLDTVRAVLATAVADDVDRADAGFAYLPVDRAFSIAGHGTVVTGTLRRGRLRSDSEIEIVPQGPRGIGRVRIRALQVHGRAVTSAAPGQRVAVNLRGVEAADVPRGVALAEPGLLTPADWLSVQLAAVAGAPPLRTGMTLQLLFGTEEVAARLRLLDRETLEPGQIALAQLHAVRPVMLPARERFILRVASPAATVAGGQVLDPAARRLRRHASRINVHLQALADASGDMILSRAIESAGGAGLTLRQLARLAGLSPARTAEALPRLDIVRTRGDTLVGRAVFDTLLAALPRLLAARAAESPAGLSRERLAALVPAAAPALLDEAASRLVADGTLRQEGGLIRVSRPDRERAEAQRDARLAERLEEAIRRGGLTPPDAPDDEHGKRMLDRLVRGGVLVRTHDRVLKRDVLFHRDAVELARHTLSPLLRQGEGLLVKEAGLALGISRKFSVPLLEYLDGIRFTRRVGDRRVLGMADAEVQPLPRPARTGRSRS